MVHVFDVAAFIVARTGAIPPLKLQKLVYYAQAWSLVRDGKPLFEQPIEAWRYGPVCPDLYEPHRGIELVPVPYPLGDAGKLPPEAQETVHAVLHAYQAKSSRWLSDLTHREDPWRNARGDLPLEARSNTPITHTSMRAYYETSDSAEKRVVIAFGRRKNPIISFIEDMSDDEAAVLDELGDLDAAPEVAKLTV
jgi:uncharacterized phage-associated protein